ncbi:hypothetical protein V5O48_000146 [Marasmius crinis-equi]|uniref:Proteophosphoglycan ppg4 n=1 Tax=Marasmius crinis-equi TaxID=585013 RepID=A0ABR3G282_9AGAR
MFSFSEPDATGVQVHKDATPVLQYTYDFNSSVAGSTDPPIVILAFAANFALIVSVGCVMSAFLVHTLLPASGQARHPHTQTVYAPSNYSHSPQSSSVLPVPRKLLTIPGDTDPAASSTSKRRLITNVRPELSEGSPDYPDPPSQLCLSNLTSPWMPGTPPKQKHKTIWSGAILGGADAQTPHQQREGVERQRSTSFSFGQDTLSATLPTPHAHISDYLDEDPVTPPLTKDDLRTPPSTGVLRTPPSLREHIRTLAAKRTPPQLTRSHSSSSSFESPGVKSLSMRLDKDGRFYHDDEDDDKYTIPPSPTPAARKRKGTVPIVRVDVHEEVDVCGYELPSRPRTTVDNNLTTPAWRRQSRRPWTSEGASNAGSAHPPVRGFASLSAFFSRSLSIGSSISRGRLSDVFHLSGGGGHAREPSQGSVRRADGFERLEGREELNEKPRRNFPLPIPLDQWELEALELGLGTASARSSSTLTPAKFAARKTPIPAPAPTPSQLRAQTPNSSWLADPDPFAAPPRGAVTFVSSVKDREVTKFGVGESREDFQQPPTPTRMSAWGKLVLPVPSPAHAPAVPSTPEPTLIAPANPPRRRNAKRKRTLKPAPSVIPPLPTSVPTSKSTSTPPSSPPKLSPHALFLSRPGLGRSSSSPDVRQEETFPPPSPQESWAKPLPALPQPYEMTEEALVAQQLLSRLDRDGRGTSNPAKRKKKAGGGESGGESESPEGSRLRTKSLASGLGGRGRNGSLLSGIGKGLGVAKGDGGVTGRSKSLAKEGGTGDG